MNIKQGLFVLFFSIVAPLRLWADVSSTNLQEETTLLQEHIEGNHLIHYVLFAVLILALVAIIFLVNRTKKIKLQNEQLEKQSLELKNSERKYHEIFDFSLDTIITSDPNGIITNANQAAEEMLDYHPNELIGKDIKLIYASEDVYLTVIGELRKTDNFSGEILNRTKDDKIIITRLSANQIRNRAGEVIGTMGISRDITEESLLKEEYSKLINNVSDIIYTTDINGNFTYTNRPVQSILGYSSNEIVDKSFEDLIDADDLLRVSNHFREVFQKRLKESYLEFKVKTKNNTVVWIGQQVNTKFNKLDSSKVDGYYGIIRVIDERKRAELKLQGSEEKYRDLIDSTSDLVQVIDDMGRFMYVNQAWKRILKYSDEDLKEVNVFDLIHEESIEHCISIFELIKSQAELERERIIYSLVSKDGEKIIVEGSFHAKYDNEGNVVSVQSFLRNVTKQKEAEKQLAQKESTLRQITETINDVFYLYNIVEDKYEYISPNCEVTLGANQQFFYDGRNHTSAFVYHEDIEELNKAKSTIDEGFSYDIDFRIIVNEEIRWINEKSFAIRGENGNIIANSGICRDVTEIREANQIIHRQNVEIGASILYAKRIQDAVLPTTAEINNVQPGSWVIFRPKDVVSGDFYIVEGIKSHDGTSLSTFIVGDCTGHGVPGAVLSLMCNVLVRESFKRHDVNTPATALNYVRKRLTIFFSTTEEKNIRDGMDIAFCVLDSTHKKLYFSGANSNCIIVRNGEIQILRGNRQHVGYDEDPKPFKDYLIDVEKGDRIYLYSDGFPDQFGGERGKKFGKPRLHSLLENEKGLSMQKLCELLAKELDNWQGDTDQVDDITIVGVEV